MAITIEGRTCAEVWERSVAYLIQQGEYVSSIRGPVIECVDVSLVVSQPREDPRISKLSPVFHQAENFGTSLTKHPRIIDWDGTNQLDRVIDLLNADPLSRRAVVSVWNPKYDLQAENAHGVVSLIFSIRDNSLRLTSIFRTTDAWMCNWSLAGVPELQDFVCTRLRKHEHFDKLKVGTYTQFHSSFHIYLDEVKNAEMKLLSNDLSGT